MPRKKSYLTATDCFCGAGGSSQGAKRAGVEVKMALNHWKLAIETHSTNFPETDHDCTDVSACDPRRYPSTDIGIFSPECTTHSPAGGNRHQAVRNQLSLYSTGKIDPATERSRATMWDVVRFAEYHNYNVVIVENVVEAKTRWGLFDAWLHAMHMLGYRHRCVFLNSMHCQPTPQSRDRMYVVFWKEGNRAPMLDYTPAAHCPKCSCDVLGVQTWKDKRKNWGKYRTQYVYCCPTCSTIVEPYYYAAFNIIDWSNLGTRIGDRKKPLADKTMARIRYGLDKYGSRPLVVRNQTPGNCKPVSGNIGAITTDDTHAVLNPPFLVDNKQTTGVGHRVRGAEQATCTMHTEPGVGLVTPFLVDSAFGGKSRLASEVKSAQTTQHTEGLVTMPFIYNGSMSRSIHPVTAVKNTQTTHNAGAIITPPLLTELRGFSKARPATREMNTVTAGGIHSGIVTDDSFRSFISHVYGNSYTREVTETIGTVRTKETHEIISYRVPEPEECFYRMLFPTEIQRAMAFADDYTVLGTSKDKVKQLGNAVTPPAMEWLVKQAVNSLS